MGQFCEVVSGNGINFGIKDLVIPNGAIGVRRQPYLNLIGKVAGLLLDKLEYRRLGPEINWMLFVTGGTPTSRGFALLALIETAVKNNGTDKLYEALTSGIDRRIWTYRDGNNAYTHIPTDPNGLEREAKFARDILEGGPKFQRINLLLRQAITTLENRTAPLSEEQGTSVRSILVGIQLLNRPI